MALTTDFDSSFADDVRHSPPEEAPMSLRSDLHVRRARRSVASLCEHHGVSTAIERLAARHGVTPNASGWDDVARARRIAGHAVSVTAGTPPDVRAVTIWHLIRETGIDASIVEAKPGKFKVLVGNVAI